MPCVRRRARAETLRRLGSVKLLFDQNLSPRLVDRLAGLFPGSAHVREHGLAAVEALLRRHEADLAAFEVDVVAALVVFT